MAERRMFSKTVTNAARFLMMPASARLFYYDLGMAADDDGIVEAFVVMRISGADMSDLELLEKKGYVGHKAYGKTHEYYPLVEREEYTNGYMNSVLNNFFGGSVSRMISFFTRNEKISLTETDEILKMLQDKK